MEKNIKEKQSKFRDKHLTCERCGHKDIRVRGEQKFCRVCGYVSQLKIEKEDEIL